MKDNQNNIKCEHKNTKIWEPHLAGARKCVDCEAEKLSSSGDWFYPDTTKSIVMSVKIYPSHIDARMICPESLHKTAINELPPTESFIMTSVATFLSWMQINERTKKSAIIRINEKVVFDTYTQ